MTPTIAVVGSGAVGLYYGGRLAQAGCPVHFLLRSDFDSVSSHGLHVRSCDGDFFLAPSAFEAHRSVEGIPPVDLLLVALKTTSNPSFPTLLPSLVKPTTVIVTLQNGLGNEDALAGLFPANPVMGGIAFTCINRVYDSAEGGRAGAGFVVDHTSHGLIRLGGFGGGRDGELVAGVASLFQRSRIRCEAIGDLMHGRWRKLVWNVPFNGLGAAMDLATDQLLASEAGTQLVSRLMYEIMAASAGVGLPFPDPDGLVHDQVAQTKEMARYHTSMQLDRRHRRPLEHEAIIGEPLRRGVAAGVEMPETARLYEYLSVVNSAISGV